MRKSILCILAIMAFVLLVPAGAQCFDITAEPGAPVDWKGLLGLFINSFAVVAAVKLLTVAMPTIREKIGWVIPILAMIIGPLLALASNAISEAIGVPVDLNPIAAVFAGGSAVAFYQVGRQVKKKQIANIPERLSYLRGKSGG